jgi:gamma-glutamyltranspeptidase/glutathione hydrolase
VDGSTPDSVTIESDLAASARAAVGGAGLRLTEIAARSENLGQTNVVFVDDSGSMTAASDPRSDGAGVVAHYPRLWPN